MDSKEENNELKQPIVTELTEPIKNQNIPPINQPNFSVNYPGGQGYLGQDPNANANRGSNPQMFQRGPPTSGGHPMTGQNMMQNMPVPMMGPMMQQGSRPISQQGGIPGQMMGGGPQGMGMVAPRVMGQEMGKPGGFQQGPPAQGGGMQAQMHGNDEYQNMNYEKSYACYEDCMQSCCSCCGQCRQFIPCLCVDYPNVEVPQSFCGLKLRFGRYVETMSAGLQFVTPSTEKLILVDLQTQTLDLVKQNIITKDNITATIDTAINFKIINPRYALFRLDNLQESVKNITYSALRSVCGVYTLTDIQEKKQEITAQLQNYISQRVKTWGIIIEQIFIKDIILSNDLQQTLSSAAKMQKAAESKVISAKADVESAKLMKEAADSLSSTAAMQIRYYEAISNLGVNQSQKVVFIPFVQDQEF